MEVIETDKLDALKRGDETVFEMIFKTHYQALCNYAYSILEDKDEAEEVVQSSFLTLWEKRSSIDIKTSLKSYLYTAVRNNCLNKIKHLSIRRKHEEYTLSTSSGALDSTSNKVISRELEKKIAASLEKLPEQCRLVFKLSRFEELKYAEIAEHLGISIKTVENQIGKALKIMREELKEYLPLLLILIKAFFN